jgi:hypothetical protein
MKFSFLVRPRTLLVPAVLLTASEYLHAHFKRRQIEDLVSEHTNGWTDYKYEVDIQTGACFKPMRLVVNSFAPKTYLLQYQNRLPTTLEKSGRWPINQTSANIGLMSMSTTELKETCREHVEEMVDNPDYALQVTVEDSNPMPYTILVAAQEYYKVTGVRIVHPWMCFQLTVADSTHWPSVDVTLDPLLSEEFSNTH